MPAIPHELAWGEVYFPPLLLVVALAYSLTTVITTAIVKAGWHRYVAQPAIAEICLTIIFTGVLSRFINIF
ncbi:DUF1656 domain-containing protein [Psychromonas sp. psych-6C06]|uniref:DUF1656 domain-containing protein n=1 Tax=Psychromonas sp. psych-6C06 TaxID=2058089 RepID=UPI000C34EAA3|nr:DUF1656 domain-containing protein [Psychromonas sp. psych-6C06]PKF61577.1 DUF1656 domain-containing protein [Psychromonas sp. psych-6C06]